MSTAPSGPRAASHPPRPVDLAAIERELTQLWKPPDAPDGSHKVLTRACMSNLMIYCATADQACVVNEEVDTIVLWHPCRVLLLVGEDGTAGDDLEASIAAHCHLAGENHQVCSEHVTVSASGGAVRRLASAARELVIGDLPTSLWWAGEEAPALNVAPFDELKDMAAQVLYSSLSWGDPARGTLTMARWAANAEPDAPVIADLAWRLLKPWRKLMAQALDPAVQPGALDSIRRVEVEHGPRGLPEAWLLAGWLAARLGWQLDGEARTRGREGSWRFRSASGPVEVRFRTRAEAAPEVCCAEVAWKAGPQEVTMTFAALEPGRIGVTCRGLEVEPRVLTTTPQSRALLVAAQLQERARDLAFYEALDVARRMAEALTS